MRTDKPTQSLAAARPALLAALRPGVLWEEWAAEAQKLMPRGQKLTWSSINWPAGTEAMR